MGKLVFDRVNTYLAVINNLPASRIFRHCFFKNKQGESIDVAQNGRFSCALVVSSVLYRVGLISRIRITVASLVRDLEWNNWKKSNDLLIGAVLVWEPRIAGDGEQHRHIGFYLGENRCVSNDPRTPEEGSTFAPIVHDLYMNDLFPSEDKKVVRQLEHIFVHPLLLR